MSYLTFEEAPPANKRSKTKRWVVVSVRIGAPLGRVFWFSRWRQYTFTPARDTTFNPDCLREIADFVERETEQHRRRAAVR